MFQACRILRRFQKAMIYLLIAILFNIGIFISFRAFAKFEVNTMQAITWNYLAGAIFGILFTGIFPMPTMALFAKPWFPFAMVLSFLFVVTFILINETTRRFNVTVTSVSNKIALVLPVMSSIFILKTEQGSFGIMQWLGLLFALSAIILTSIRKTESGGKVSRSWEIIFPLLVFLFGGTIDSLVNYTNFYFLMEGEGVPFSIWLFALSFLISLAFMVTRNQKWELKSIPWGFVLGACNYFSLHFVLRALDALNNNGALFYPLFNIGVILGATIAAYLIFRDKLLRINVIGLALAVVALALLALRVIGQ
jgi:drug/metabolite transporter (DMT)-like permease